MPSAVSDCLPSCLGQIIIAGGEDDVSPAEMIEWVLPVLSGISGGGWLTCEVLASQRGTLTVRLRTGATPAHLALCCSITRARALHVRRLLPARPPAALILVNDHAAQVMTLLDGMARWLNVFEADDPALAPIMTMLKSCGAAQADALIAAAGA